MVFFNVSSDTFIIYKHAMRCSGIWPLERGKASVVIYTFFLMLEIVALSSRLIDPYGNCTEQKVGDADITNTSWFVTVIIMRFTVRVNGKKLIPLIESTSDDWSSITDPEEREIMKRNDKSGTVVFIARNIGAVAICVGQGVLTAIYPKHFPALDQRVCAFEGHIIWSLVTKFSMTVVAIGNHLTINFCLILVWSFALHLSAQYKILKKRFQEFLLIKNKKEGRQVLRRLVDRHNQLLDLSGCLEDSFVFFSGLHIIRTQILICLCASQLGYAMKAAEFVVILDSLKNMVLLLFLPIIYYCAGDYLTESAEEVGEVFTQCNWYDLSKDSITNFSIIIARTRKPPRLTLWKFHQLNLSNLKHSLDALYSYVSLIVGVVLD